MNLLRFVLCTLFHRRAWVTTWRDTEQTKHRACLYCGRNWFERRAK